MSAKLSTIQHLRSLAEQAKQAVAQVATAAADAIEEIAGQLSAHTGSKANPHGVTAAQVGLGNVANVKPPMFYGTCSTAAGTQAKAVTLANAAGFSLAAGVSVRIKFTAAQTYSGQPTLNVNGIGAKNIVRNGTTAGMRYMWSAGEVVDFVYDGTNWVAVDGAVATTTYYGVTKLSSATNSTSTTLAATPSAVKEAYDLAASKAAGDHTHNYLPLDGGTLTGNLNGKYITGTWLQGTASNHLDSAATKIAVQDGQGWIYHRTAAELRGDIGAASMSEVQTAINDAIGAVIAASY